MLYLAGELMNLVGRGPQAIVVTNEDALYPRANLHDDRPSKEFRCGSIVADWACTIDGCLLENPGFEDGIAVGWTTSTTGSGTASEETTTVHAGSKALKLHGGVPGMGECHQDITVRSGERLQVDVWGYGGTTGSIRYRILCLETGHYLTAAAAWSDSVSDFATRATASWGQTVFPFHVEAWSVLQQATCTLRVWAYCNEDVDTYVDDYAVYQAVNFCSGHGHNLTPAVSPLLRSGDSTASWTTRATMAPKRPAFYSYLSTAIYARYWQLQLSGTPSAIPYLGELVIGYAETTTRGQRYGWTTDHDIQAVRAKTDGGDPYVYRVGSAEQRVLSLDLDAGSEATLAEALDEIWRRCNRDEHPAIIVPYSSESRVHYGRLAGPFSETRDFLTLWSSGLQLSEAPFPMIGA